MAETLNENTNSSISEKDQAILDAEDQKLLEVEEETDDPAVLKERLANVSEKNKQLFVRTKKAEGFELKDGKWIKSIKPTEVKKPTVVTKEEDIDARIANGVISVLEQRDLDAADLSDELKTEVSNLAKMQGITIKKALASDYIAFRIEKENNKNLAENGSMPAGRKATFIKEGKIVTADPRTEEGRKAIAKRDEELRRKLG